MVDILVEAMSLLISWQVFAAMLLGATVGLILGAIPGITGTVAMAVALPITFYLQPIVAIMFLSSAYTGGVMGGSVSAILLNMPGAPGAIATAIDGFKMTEKGKHNEALGLSLWSSVFGTFFSYVLMALVLGPLSTVVTNMGPADRVAIALMAMLIISVLRSKSVSRSLIAGLIGLVLGTFGPNQAGLLRSEFLHFPMLYDGLPEIPTIIGLLVFSELIAFFGQQYVVPKDYKRPKPSMAIILKTFPKWIRYYATIGPSAIIGFIIGVVPAAGATIASLLAYGQAKSWARDPSRFGKGAEEGVVAAETANNASEGGSMLTTLSLGIPGSGAAAILMSGLMMFGLVPGPVWISQNLPFAYALIIGNLLLATAMIFLGAIIFSRMAFIIYAPIKYLAPALAVIGGVGIFSLRSSVFDIVLAWFFAYFAYFLKKNDYPPIAIILGLILGPVIDSEIYRVNIIYGDNLLALLGRPVVLGSLFVGIFLIAVNSLRAWRKNCRERTE